MASFIRTQYLNNNHALNNAAVHCLHIRLYSTLMVFFQWLILNTGPEFRKKGVNVMAGAGYGGWVLLPSPRMTSCWYILNTPSETPTSLHHYSVCKRIKVWGVKFNLRNVNISVCIQNTKKKSPFWSSHPCITWSGSLPTPAPGSGGLTFFYYVWFVTSSCDKRNW